LVLPIVAAAVVTFGPGRAIDRALRRAFRREGMFHGYPELLATVSAATVDAPLLGDLRKRISAAGIPADRMMHRLRRLMHLADLRHSGSLYLPVQLLTLWDVHVMVAVERWRQAAGPHVRAWLDALGEFEALAALGTLAHDQPAWCFPDIATGAPPRIEAHALGHPMLPDATRVTNDVAVGPPGTVLLITGSNMSGKSTLLRSLGTNTVLALAGAPVCARRMRLPVLSLQTSIRVADSVVQGVSYFMAQLQRMKQIVSAADAVGEADTPVCYLLDEILQGTNTAERRIAATRVIRHLVDGGAIGAVTTHDLELADEPELRDAIVPVHFTETVSEDGDQLRMSFDYLLRPGIATSTNALALMRMVGLDDHS
jgi:DNA mismatch repair ATPase MutS